MEKEELTSLLKDFLSSEGYSLYSLDYKKKKSENTLSIVIDRVEPIDLDAISAVSEKVSEYLDTLDPIEESYTLDISSLGAEKPLKKEDLSSYLDSFINVRLTNPVEGENIYQGKLIEVDESSITIELKIKTRVKKVNLEKENISKVRLALGY